MVTPDEDMDPLTVALRALSNQIARDEPEFAAAAEAFIARLGGAAAGAQAPQLGEVLPDCVLPDAQGRLVSLTGFQPSPLVVLFMRGHWCDFCMAQAHALNEASEQIRSLGASVVFITPERIPYAQALIEPMSGFHLLNDVDLGYTAQVGLLAAFPEDLSAMLDKMGVKLPTYQGADGWAAPIPATFVLDGQGRIVERAIDPDYRRRPTIDMVLKGILRAKG